MLAVTYHRVGPANEVLSFTEIETPSAAAGEVRVKLASSGVNPSDVKSRAGVRNKTLPFPLIVPHSDGAGVIDQVGNGVDAARIGERVWVWNAAWGRPTRAITSSSFTTLNPDDRASALAGVSSLLRENKLKHQIAARLPLSKAAEAHRLVESGKAVGNVVLDIA